MPNGFRLKRFIFKIKVITKGKTRFMKSRWIISLLSYIAVILVAISLIVGFLSTHVFNFGEEVAYWCKNIAMYLGIIVTISSAFLYSTSKRNSIYTTILVLLVIVIIVFLFLA